jgi:ferric-dicitrate binding protein FerR (iron transport regulator)
MNSRNGSSPPSSGSPLDRNQTTPDAPSWSTYRGRSLLPPRDPMAGLVATLTAVTLTACSLALFVRDTPAMEYYSTQVGEQLPVHFRDGSVITLNTDTVIKLGRDGGTLAIRILKGEVHFNMLPNPQRHLIVSVGDRIEIRDTATIFDVRVIEPGGAKVTVQEGEVKLSVANMADVQLRANQQTMVDSDSTRVAIHTHKIRARQILREFSWLQGYLDFQCETLGSAVKEFNRYNRTHIELMDEAIAKVQIGGVFSIKDPTTFAEVVEEASPAIHLDKVHGNKGTPVLQLRVPNPKLKPQSHCTPESSTDDN